MTRNLKGSLLIAATLVVVWTTSSQACCHRRRACQPAPCGSGYAYASPTGYYTADGGSAQANGGYYTGGTAAYPAGYGYGGYGYGGNPGGLGGPDVRARSAARFGRRRPRSRPLTVLRLAAGPAGVRRVSATPAGCDVGGMLGGHADGAALGARRERRSKAERRAAADCRPVSAAPMSARTALAWPSSGWRICRLSHANEERSLVLSMSGECASAASVISRLGRIERAMHWEWLGPLVPGGQEAEGGFRHFPMWALHF